MLVYQAIPEKMLMILAIIFGAHLQPYSWLYKSRFDFIGFNTFLALAIGLNFKPVILDLTMMEIEIFFFFSFSMGK